MEIIRMSDSINSKSCGRQQKVSQKWIDDNLDNKDLEKLKNGGQVGVTIKKGRGYTHVTLIAKP